MSIIPSDAVQVFAFNGAEVRALVVNGDPWWVAADVASALELGNPRSSLARLDDDEKGVHTMDTPGGPQQMVTVNEPGLYSLILRSRKPEAKSFKRWITHKVLPALRTTGSYTVSGSSAPEPATTVSWDQAAAIARLQYGFDIDTAGLRDLLSKGGILTKDLRPHRKWEHLFWPLANRWEIHAYVLPQLIRYAVTVRRQLAAAEEDLQLSLPLPMSGLLVEAPVPVARPPLLAEVLNLPRQTRGGDAS
ncbi:BRO-N domain-containing protein [Streptacidiphilus carbonis]|uniref:BRO-N domain-containing protein n=1 Tax=Streptacidiphilus carbonis TaxID=105422 RepID=UPI0006937D2C|nr:BRO family protein [Streptacidiphilus carbonis]